MSGNFAEMTTYTPFRDLLHAVKLRQGTDGVTSPAEDFFHPKNPTASAGFEPVNFGTSRPPKPLRETACSDLKNVIEFLSPSWFHSTAFQP